MIEQSGNDTFLYALLIVPLALLLIFAFYMNVLVPFSEKRDYIKREIARAYSEGEYRYWKSKLKKLYISLIPIVGKKIVKRMR